MSRFEKCPQQRYLKWCGKSCDDFDREHCDGCNLFTAYHIGRADALSEALATQKQFEEGRKENKL